MDKTQLKILFFIGIVLIIGLLVTIYNTYFNPMELKDYSQPSQSSEISATASISTNAVVHISGAVNKPGVYQLKTGLRIVDIVRLAGGALPVADLDAINLAATIKDSSKIRIPFKKTRTTSTPKKNGKNLISINSATTNELISIPGIGPKMAARIKAYITKNGPFASEKNLLKVKGIGPAKLSKIKPFIRLD